MYSMRLQRCQQLIRPVSKQPVVQVARAPEKTTWMADWESPFKDDAGRAGDLHAAGEIEMQLLGSRIRARYPKLFARGYEAHDFTFISTQVAGIEPSKKYAIVCEYDMVLALTTNRASITRMCIAACCTRGSAATTKDCSIL